MHQSDKKTTRHVGAIGGVERIKSNWEGIESCQLIEGMIFSGY
jgi:hypothetical protein